MNVTIVWIIDVVNGENDSDNAILGLENAHKIMLVTLSL